MNNSTMEEELQRKGNITSTNVGDSMMPLLRQDKDMVYIEKYTGGLKKYEVPLYKRDSGQYVLHRCIKVSKKGYVMCGDNRYTKEYGITDKHIIGVLKGVIRDGKYISTDSLRYKIYSHYVCDLFFIRAFILRVKFKLARLKKR
ncbi:MAG: hypothetical protein E7252_09910 [Lachnospira sp.]|nr:hypothetical protein [Lachnospira sp.]